MTTSSSSSGIMVAGIGKSFGGNVVLTDCNCDIRTELVTCIVGPNGAGKSTLFNIITGFVRADRGDVLYQGKSLARMSTPQVYAMGIVRSFQGVRIFRNMTVVENLMFARGAQHSLRMVLHPLRERRELGGTIDLAWKTLDDLGLAKHGNRSSASLSYAEQKLLSIGSIMMTDASFILLDEPLAGLDKASVDLFIARIRSLCAERNRSICVIEHNLNAVRRLADEVIFMAEGTVKAAGPTEEVLSREDMTRLYLGMWEADHA